MAKFIKDLGLIPNHKGKNYRWCLVECEQCGSSKELPTAKWKKYPDRLCKSCTQINKHIETRKERECAFVSKAIEIHGEKFDYSNLNFIDSVSLVNIKCTKCNSLFTQTPSNHLVIKDCPACTNVHKFTQEDFIESCKKLHPTLDYSITKYKNMAHDIEVNCQEHGVFTVNAGNHIHKGIGCLSCSDWGDNNCLYVWRLGNTNMYKIGITSLKYGVQRISKVCNDLNSLLGTNYSYDIIEYREVKNALEIEKQLHAVFNEVPLIHNKLSGKTEFRVLYGDDLNLVKSMLDEYIAKGLLS